MSYVNFVAFEAGAAAAMAPVWKALGGQARVALTSVAAKHVGVVPDLDLDADLNPDAIFSAPTENVMLSATGRTTELEILTQAHRRGIPVLQIIDTWGPYAARFVGGFAPRIATVDKFASIEATAEGLPADRLHETGNPAWEAIDAAPAASAKSIAFLAQPVSRHYRRALGYNECTAFDLLRSAKASHPDLIEEIIVVPHPEATQLDDLELDRHESRMPLAEALQKCGTVTGMFSSALVDAVLRGRKVVSIQPGKPSQDMCGLSRLGRVAKAGTVNELICAIRSNVTDGAALRTSMAGSTERVLAALTVMARK